MVEFEFDDTLAEMEKKLRCYSPAVPNLSRDRLLFESGKMAASSKLKTRLLVITNLLLAVSTLTLTYSLICSEQIQFKLKEELAKVRSDQDLELMISENEPVDRELQPTSYLALMRQADLYSLDPLMTESPHSGASPAVSTPEQETNILSVRSSLEF
jgi:hypothetical protein